MVVEFGDDFVDLGDFDAAGVGGGSAGEDGEEEDFGVGEVFAVFEDDGADAFGDFGAGVGAGVVGADHEHDGFGLEALTFTVFETPEDALGGVAGDGEVGDLDVAEVFLVGVGAVHFPPVGDGVAFEEEVDVSGFGLFDEAEVAWALALCGLGVGGGDVGARSSDGEEGVVFEEEGFDVGGVGIDKAV